MFEFICFMNIGSSQVNSVTSETCLNEVSLSWNVTSDLMKYGPVFYMLTISSDVAVGMTYSINDTSYYCDELTPGTDYVVSIAPSNSVGIGKAYNLSIRTAPNSKC